MFTLVASQRSVDSSHTSSKYRSEVCLLPPPQSVRTVLVVLLAYEQELDKGHLCQAPLLYVAIVRPDVKGSKARRLAKEYRLLPSSR